MAGVVTRPVIRFRIDFGPDKAVGPGKIALLEQIAVDGSLRLAARHRSVSYRRAWLLLKSLNSSFTEPVTISTKGGRGGGGMKLTPLGEQVIEVYRTFEVEIQQQAARLLGYLKARVPKAKPTDKGAPVVHLYQRK